MWKMWKFFCIPKRTRDGSIFYLCRVRREKKLSRSGKAQGAGDFPHGRDAKVDVFVERHT
jgi:hypothetical protein